MINKYFISINNYSYKKMNKHIEVFIKCKLRIVITATQRGLHYPCVSTLGIIFRLFIYFLIVY